MNKYFSAMALIARPRSVILAIAAVLMAAAPFVMQFGTPSAAQVGTVPGLTAQLSGPAIGGMIPNGFAVYTAGPTATNTAGRQLSVNINNVNLPAGTHLGVALNNTGIGTITLDNNKHGVLLLSTNNGGTVPTVAVGDMISVRGSNTAAPILTGTFGPPPSQSPTPSVSPTVPPPSPTPVPLPVRYWAQLTGPAIDGILPRGLAQYDFTPNFRNLKVFASYVNLPENTALAVLIEGTQVGNLVLHNHQGQFQCGNAGTTTPVNCPTVNLGDDIELRNGNAVVLSGVFSNTPPPPGSPTPTPSVTPTPHPPTPIATFLANLRGANVVPPVTTSAKGIGMINLVPSPTANTTLRIAVRLTFNGLSGPPTAMTINGPAMPDENGPVIFNLATIATTPGTATGVQFFNITIEQLAQLRAGLWYFNVATANNPGGEIRGQIRSTNHRDDFDGDGVSEIAVVRSVEGEAAVNAANIWFTANSADGTFTAVSIGHPGDMNVQGDYDGDGTADIAMFTPSDGTWQIRGSSTGEIRSYHWGMNGDIPVVGDFDGDGLNDLTVFRPSAGLWYTQQSTDGRMIVTTWGLAGDKPVSGDFDGDGRSDLAVWRPSDGTWYVVRSSDGGITIEQWGLSDDRPVAGDFDGDGLADLAVYRPSQGNWYIRTSANNRFTVTRFGLAGDIPVPCEFDGDGITDIAVFRPSDGTWYIMRSSDLTMFVYRFGLSTDRPTATVYVQ